MLQARILKSSPARSEQERDPATSAPATSANVPIVIIHDGKRVTYVPAIAASRRGTAQQRQTTDSSSSYCTVRFFRSKEVMANQVPTGTTQPSSSSDLAPKEALNGNAYPTVSATLQGKGQDCAVPTMSPVTTMATTSASRSPSSSPLSSAVDVRFPPTSQHGSKVTLEEELTSSMHQNHGSASNLSMSAFPRNPLSPMSAPHLASGPGWSFSAPNSTTTTPTPSSVPTVPTIIHTQSGAARSGPTPYFPLAMPESASYPKLHNNSASGGGKSVQVNAKKKHNIKASTSSTSLHSADGTTSSASNSVSGGGGGGGEVTVRRQKRLERNRESARLSRRRRKQYLEILEEKVNRLSLETDQGRRQHARRAVDQILQLRSQVLQDAEVMMEQGGSADNNNNHDEHYLHQAAARLDGPLSRANNEFQVLSTFWTQQLKSFSLPADTKAILWLTLQGDAFFRGGRSASERLSAARIGERVRTNRITRLNCFRHTTAFWICFSHLCARCFCLLLFRCSTAATTRPLPPIPCGH